MSIIKLYLSKFADIYVSYATLVVKHFNVILLGLLIASIPFSIRHVFETPFNFATGAYSDFTSISLYLSDILVIILIMTNWRIFKILPKSLIFITLWIIIEILTHRNENIALQIYFSGRIVTLFLLIFILKHIIFSHLQKQYFAILFIILGFLQAMIAIIQFYTQKSIGLYFIGESYLDPNAYGIAKIVAHGTKFIRGYGSFPHPNILSAFLIVSLLSNLYLLTRNYHILTKIVLHGTLFSIIFGVFITFSRAGITAIIGALLLWIIFLIKSKTKGRWNVAITTIFTLFISFTLLFPYLLTRATITDHSTKERGVYNQIGLKMIANQPVFGTGPGLSVLHMEQFSLTKLETWEIQPIHNFYLILIAEWGIGALFGIFIIFLFIFRLFKVNFSVLTTGNIEPWNAMLIIISLTFLYLFFFDHYFYTIWQTQLLLCLIIGLILNQLNRYQVGEVPR